MTWSRRQSASGPVDRGEGRQEMVSLIHEGPGPETALTCAPGCSQGRAGAVRGAVRAGACGPRGSREAELAGGAGIPSGKTPQPTQCLRQEKAGK